MSRDFTRQSFLGPESEQALSRTKAGLIGAGGGGSHVGQQLAHAGVGNFVAADDQRIDNSNLNRLVGGTWQDVLDKSPKVEILERMIKAIHPSASVNAHASKWQEAQVAFRDCDVIFSCVDSYSERDQIERFARRFGIVLIDIGMDVFSVGERFCIIGQVISSCPGGPCLRCLGLITEENLKEEAERYGEAGPNPQVVWANGVLASMAVGVFMQFVTPWHDDHQPTIYLEYNGNLGTVAVSNRLKYVKLPVCSHFSESEVGDPYFGK